MTASWLQAVLIAVVLGCPATCAAAHGGLWSSADPHPAQPHEHQCFCAGQSDIVARTGADITVPAANLAGTEWDVPTLAPATTPGDVIHTGSDAPPSAGGVGPLLI
jgi:hypothetical protein